MVSYAALNKSPKVLFFSEVQSHSGEWLKPGGEKEGTPLAVVFVFTCNLLAPPLPLTHNELLRRDTRLLDM